MAAFTSSIPSILGLVTILCSSFDMSIRSTSLEDGLFWSETFDSAFAGGGIRGEASTLEDADGTPPSGWQADYFLSEGVVNSNFLLRI
jgi:hypothetical protein